MLESYEDFAEFISKRIAQLRIQKNISAREMSLSLGLGAAYINHIENKNNMPSMEGLYDICEFLGISPKDFFDEESEAPAILLELTEEAKRFDAETLQKLLELIKLINR